MEASKFTKKKFSLQFATKNPFPVQRDEFAEKVSAQYGMPVKHENGFSEKLYGMKISEALIKLSEPLHPEGRFDIDTFKSIIDVAAIAWNLSCIPEEGRRNCLEYVLHKSEKNATCLALPEEEKKALMGELDFLMERKKELFPSINCIISNVKVIDEGSEFRVLVATELHVEPFLKRLFLGMKIFLLKLYGLHGWKKRL